MQKCLCVIAVLSAVSSPLRAATELQYSGTLTQLKRGGPSTPVKQFDVYVLVRPDGQSQQCFYQVSERGGGGWAWPERFGQVTLNAENQKSVGRPAHILHMHDGTNYPVELAAPFFPFAQKLAPEAEWTSGKLSYAVSRERKVADRDCWQIDAADNFGRRQSFFVQKDGALLVAAERRVFMGQGDEFQLRMELSGSRDVGGDALTPTAAVADGLISLQSALDREGGETKPELSSEQLETTTAVLTGLVAASSKTPLKNLVVAISRDVSSQSRRTDDIASLAKRFVGQPSPDFTLTTLRKKTVSLKAQKGRVTVLHFWDYKGDPITEPYGQVGYLDFLLTRRGRLGVEVFGIAVNSGFGDPQKNGAALRSVRKLRDFMNLSYPIAMDAGGTLEKFGDPRSLGAKLPVWVVIGADGKITHYHVGFYAIKPDQGLSELDAAVVRTIRDQRTKPE